MIATFLTFCLIAFRKEINLQERCGTFASGVISTSRINCAPSGARTWPSGRHKSRDAEIFSLARGACTLRVQIEGLHLPPCQQSSSDPPPPSPSSTIHLAVDCCLPPHGAPSTLPLTAASLPMKRRPPRR
ncbi:hypothetical protein VPH35_108325 [Triticum aestivum]